ncbi:hypothetical protein ACFQRC_07350 [Enterovirga sp. GCM10030262]|uniref:hypothetical protein n=1 Tax=Enterovirga sp. GCM10030262 TaxID=3273391 RepID=UPI003620CB27
MSFLVLPVFVAGTAVARAAAVVRLLAGARDVAQLAVCQLAHPVPFLVSTERAGTASEAKARDRDREESRDRRAVNATGTPTFIVGDQLLQRAVSYEVLRQAIPEERAQ